jgi:hypothetical protein|tara:strand:+ start:107 stop:787 length:681 start_codon:yes stop_codon:yes gene_type:complete
MLRKVTLNYSIGYQEKLKIGLLCQIDLESTKMKLINKIVLVVLLLAPGCSKNLTSIDRTTKQETAPSCGPQNSDAAYTTTADELLFFSDTHYNFMIDLQTNKKTCAPYKGKINSELPSEDINILIGMAEDLAAGHSPIILSQRKLVSSPTLFRTNITKECPAMGLPLVFESNADKHSVVIGCQKNPNLASAVMWKFESEKNELEVAYFVIYKNVVENILARIGTTP